MFTQRGEDCEGGKKRHGEDREGGREVKMRWREIQSRRE